MQPHIDRPIIRVWIINTGEEEEEEKRWTDGRRGREIEKMNSGGRIFRRIISTRDGEI